MKWGVTLDGSSFEEFRRQARRWLAVLAAEAPAGQRSYRAQGRRLAVFDSAHLRPGHSVDSVLLVDGDFTCGAGCVFQFPIYVSGHCEIGKHSRLKAVYAEKNLVLGASVEAQAWVASGGDMEIRPGVTIRGEAVSRGRIHLGERCAAGSVHAREVSAPAGESESPVEDRRGVVNLPAPGNRRALPRLEIPGLDPARLEAASADTWFYDGDLYLSEPVALSAHLVTRGFFTCQAGSLLDGDVLAGSTLNVGEDSVVRGHLKAGEDLVIEARSVFQGDVASQGRIRLCTGVRGFRAGGPVTVSAARNIVVEPGVLIKGQVDSGERVLTVARERIAPVERLLAAGF
jgi:cytoskeletal protein CcmA (bactofilin family)